MSTLLVDSNVILDVVRARATIGCGIRAPIHQLCLCCSRSEYSRYASVERLGTVAPRRPRFFAPIVARTLTEDPTWFDWSSQTLAKLAAAHMLAINPVIYAEVSVGFERIEALDAALPGGFFRRLPLPWPAAFLAGKCFLRYRRAGGARRSPLPDFYIGAHAAVAGMALITRDTRRNATYFPKLELIAPTRQAVE